MRVLLNHLITALAIIGFALGSARAAEANEWRFKVFLDDDEIGYHSFKVSNNGSRETVNIQARFDVKFLLVTAYSYRHENTEVWEGDCLQKIISTTDDNGDDYTVSGAVEGDSFMVATNNGGAQLPKCVMTFSYWNPDFLKQPQLLNAQTGEYIPVTITPAGQQTAIIRGRPVASVRYILSGRGIDDIELWYTETGEWLRLESTTEKGYRIKYELQ